MTHPSNSSRTPREKIRLGVLASGDGTNFQAIIAAIEQGTLFAKICVLVCNNPQAKTIKRAEKHQIPVAIVDHKEFPDRDAFTHALCAWLKNYEVDLVVLAGFMRILGGEAMQKFPQRIINIHPSLLPAFPGLNAIEKAYEQGCKETGITVHFVDEGLDSGPIIVQKTVAIQKGDSLEELETHMHEIEHQLYPQVIQWFAENRIEVDNGKVTIQHDS